MEEEEQKISTGLWCLRYGNWTWEVLKDDLCVEGAMPQCRDCQWSAMNMTIKGRPLDDIPKPIYLSYNYEENGDFLCCSHGSFWLRRNKGSKPSEDEWIFIDGYEECKCKSSKNNPG